MSRSQDELGSDDASTTGVRIKVSQGHLRKFI